MYRTRKGIERSTDLHVNDEAYLADVTGTVSIVRTGQANRLAAGDCRFVGSPTVQLVKPVDLNLAASNGGRSAYSNHSTGCFFMVEPMQNCECVCHVFHTWSRVRVFVTSVC